MTTTSGDHGGSPPGDALVIRPPRQERTRLMWARILDAGVALLEDEGYEGFTIAAVCERAGVPPRAIYDRTASKDGLFLAVYEHGVGRLRADQEVFGRAERWDGLRPEELVRQAVAEVAAMFGRNAAFLRRVVLLSGAHPEVYRRGRGHVRALSDLFTSVVVRTRQRITHNDAEEAVRLCFGTVFSTCVMRVAYGPGFAFPAVDDDTFTRHLGDTAVRYLLGTTRG